ncbi:MAG: hypothetical protein WCO14_02945 [bacterium]
MGEERSNASAPPTIDEARLAALRFFEESLNLEGARLFAVRKSADGWEASAEVFEDSAFIKSLGLSTRTKDRNIYHLKLSALLDVVSYEREESSREVSRKS